MAGFALRRNTVFDWNGTNFRIDRVQPNGDVLVERIEDGVLSVILREELLAEYEGGAISSARASLYRGPATAVFSRPLSDLTPAARKGFERRQYYLKSILDAGEPIFTNDYLKPLILEAAKRVNDERPPAVITVYRWYRRLQMVGDTRALIPRIDQRGSRNLRQDQLVLNLMSRAVEDAYMASPLATGRSIHARLLASLDAENRGRLPSDHIKAPSLRTVYRMLARMDAHELAVLREGKPAADRRFRVVKAGVKTEHVLERVEIDHTPLDLFLIDGKTFLPLGRPTLTVVIDHFSRMLLGFHLSFESPSTAAVVGALRHAILPKRRAVEVIPGIRCEGKWNCYGLPDVLVVDNGLEFHGNDLESIAFDLGIRIQYCPKRQPRFKGVVERYLKTVNHSFAHQMPGVSFSRFHLRGDYDPQKHALLTFEEFCQLFEKWVVDVYSETLHKGIGTTPRARWAEGVTRREPELPRDLQTLQRRIGRVGERKLRQDGIQLNGIRYNGDELAPILRAYGAGVQVRVTYDPENLGEIQVWGPDDIDPVSVQALDQNYARGLTARQNEMIRQVLREQGDGAEDRASLTRAREELSRAVDELISSRKQMARRRGAALRGTSSNVVRPERREATFAEAPNSTSQTKSRKKSASAAKSDEEIPQLLPTFRLTRRNGGAR